MRRLFQFRLRTLFVVVTVSALAALWWSHRLHCLAKAAFHRAEIVRCREQQARDKDEFVAAYAKQRNPKRSPPEDLARAVFTQMIANFQTDLSEREAELEKQIAESKKQLAAWEKKLAESKAKMEERELRGPSPGESTSRSQRWEDQTVYDSMAQGYLVVPAPGAGMFSGREENGNEDPPPKTAWQQQDAPDVMADSFTTTAEPPKAAEKESEEPDLVMTYEFKVAALTREIAIHSELGDQYMRAIYRPWMQVDESELSETKSP